MNPDTVHGDGAIPEGTGGLITAPARAGAPLRRPIDPPVADRCDWPVGDCAGGTAAVANAALERAAKLCEDVAEKFTDLVREDRVGMRTAQSLANAIRALKTLDTQEVMGGADRHEEAEQAAMYRFLRDTDGLGVQQICWRFDAACTDEANRSVDDTVRAAMESARALKTAEQPQEPNLPPCAG